MAISVKELEEIRVLAKEKNFSHYLAKAQNFPAKEFFVACLLSLDKEATIHFINTTIAFVDFAEKLSLIIDAAVELEEKAACKNTVN